MKYAYVQVIQQVYLPGKNNSYSYIKVHRNEEVLLL